jgi:tetratricopeptide (TPR) repeat protein
MRAPSAAPAPVAHVGGIGAASSRELEDALDEAEFFCSRGLYDDARAILTEQLGKHPNNPLLRERVAELDAQDEQRGSGARERPRDEPDRAYDIAASLDALESLDYNGIQPAEGHAGPDQQVDVEEVFAKFKEGVAKQISVDDSDSHYNLGIAYKEMMLMEPAVEEFKKAMVDPERTLECCSMLSICEQAVGNMDGAIEWLNKGIGTPGFPPEDSIGLRYDLEPPYLLESSDSFSAEEMGLYRSMGEARAAPTEPKATADRLAKTKLRRVIMLPLRLEFSRDRGSDALPARADHIAD